MCKSLKCGLVLGVFMLIASAHAENWPQWRGPSGVGASDETDLPITWNGKTGQNILWTTSLKGFTGYASPIVWGDRVFLTGADHLTKDQEQAKQIPLHHINCYSIADGKLLWSTLIDPGKQPISWEGYATPTPCTDGKTVFAWFSSAVAAAVSADDGHLIWRHEREGPFYVNPGICSSPILYQDTVLLLCDQGRDNGWLAALDKKTGEIKWQQKRVKLDPVTSTPVLLQVNGKAQLIIAASRELQGLDPSNGEKIWWCKMHSFGASPAYGDGLIYIDSGNGNMSAAVDPTGSGDVTGTHLKWSLPKVPCQYGSPIVVGDFVYRQSDKTQMITCWNVKSGEQLFNERVEGINKLCSPFATADGKIYYASFGKSYVLKAGPKLEVLAVNELPGGGTNGASAAVSNGKIFIRGRDALVCIGTK